MTEHTGLAHEAPDQYTVGELCAECRRPLSRYNAYTVCGPCRMELSGTTTVVGGITDDELRHVLRFTQRKPVRRGPLGA